MTDPIDNTTDPAADERFPNIVPFDPEVDVVDVADNHGGCITQTIEEVHPEDGTTFPV